MPILLARGDGSGTDAYAALRHLEALNPIPEAARDQTPLFILGTPGRPLTHASLTLAVRRAINAAGCNAIDRSFSGRSLRVGGATDLAASATPEDSIRALGRWDSTAHRAYTRVTQAQALRYSAIMGGHQSANDPTLEDAFPGYVQPAP